MATVRFTANLQRHLEVPECEVDSGTVRSVLDSVFRDHPRLRSYVLDDQGRVRQHVAIFVDGAQIRDRQALSDPVATHSEIYVIQALSGG